MIPNKPYFKRKSYSKYLLHFDKNFQKLIRELENCSDRNTDCDCCDKKEVCREIFDKGLTRAYETFRRYEMTESELMKIEIKLQKAGCI